VDVGGVSTPIKQNKQMLTVRLYPKYVVLARETTIMNHPPQVCFEQTIDHRMLN
jgi:hypothetical protein